MGSKETTVEGRNPTTQERCKEAAELEETQIESYECLCIGLERGCDDSFGIIPVKD